METIQNIFISGWQVAAEMAPYLLFGFLFAGILANFLTPAFVERHLSGRGIVSWIKAALLGVPMPLCSCSVIPVTVSLYKHGAGRGATASFLASTPQTGVDSILVTNSLLGWPFAIFRVIVAFFSGIICGGAVEVLAGARKVTVRPMPGSTFTHDPFNIKKTLHYAFVKMPRDIGKSLTIGIIISALIGALVPEDFFTTYLSNPWLSMLLMLVVGLPMYVCSTASVPIALGFILKGLSPGAALVFLITGPATNGATIAAMAQTLGKKSMFIYLITLCAIALGSGFLIDQVPEIMNYVQATAQSCHGEAPSMINNLWLGLLIAILIYGYVSGKKAACCSSKSNAQSGSCCSSKEETAGGCCSSDEEKSGGCGCSGDSEAGGCGCDSDDCGCKTGGGCNCGDQPEKPSGCCSSEKEEKSGGCCSSEKEEKSGGCCSSEKEEKSGGCCSSEKEEKPGGCCSSEKEEKPGGCCSSEKEEKSGGCCSK